MATKCREARANFSLTYARGGNPFSQNLTLSDFSLSLGVGAASSSLDVTLLYNGCNNFADVPPTIAEIGRACTFVCNNIVFGGIVNQSSYSESSSGFTFKLRLIDPRRILDNVTVLIKDYYCPIQGIPNFINAANLLEPGVAVCPPGEDTQNWPRIGNCGAFGTSGFPGLSPNNGVSMLKLMQKLTGQTVYTTIGEALTLDLSQVIGALTRAEWSKTDSSNASLSSLIGQACDDSACDFYVELIGTVIRVVVIDRSIPFVPGALLGVMQQGYSQGTLLNSEYGFQEIYAPSNKVILGDKVTYLTETDTRTNLSMMLGYDSQGKAVRVSQTNFTAKIDVRMLKFGLGINLGADDFPITEEEILCAGSMQMWMIYGLSVNRGSLSAKILNILGLDEAGGNIKGVMQAFQALNNPAGDLETWKKAMSDLGKLSSQTIKEANITIYEQAWKWFDSFIKEWYGKKWLVPIREFCVFPAQNNLWSVKGDTGQFHLSDVPADSAFPSPSQIQGGIRGLRIGVDTALFETSDNKLTGFIDLPINQTLNRRINGKNIPFRVSRNDMNQSGYVVQNNRYYVKISTDGEVHRNPSSNKPEVLISTDGQIGMLPYFGEQNKNLVNQGMRAFAVLFGIEKYQEVHKKTKGFADISTLNILNLNLASGGFDYAVIPMRSNVYVYGPYISGNGSIGSTDVRIDSGLNPWNFGGYEMMNTVGQGLAANGLRLTNKEESGSFTLAEPPGYSINDFVGYGIIIDNVNVNYNSSGVTTNYSFRAFSPKFGDYGQALADRAKELSRLRNEAFNRVREARRQTISQVNTLFGALSKIFKPGEDPRQDQPHNMKSPSFIIVGGYYDTQKTNNTGAGGFPFNPVEAKEELSCQEVCEHKPKPFPEAPDGSSSKSRMYEIGLNTKHEIEDGVKGVGFYNVAVMSLDGLLSPVSLKGRNNRMSRYCNSWNKELVINKSRPSMPPIETQLGINQTFLNPITSKAILNTWNNRGNSEFGFNINYVAFGDDVSEMCKNLDKKHRDTFDEFAFSALRGPLVLQAWGYDTENKPIPNIVDSPSDAERGIFKNSGTKNKFMTNWLDNPGAWPVGPIDLRFDRERGVWVCPPPDRIVVAQLLSELSAYGTAKAALLNPTSGGGRFYQDYGIYGPNGEDWGTDIKSKTITVCDFLGRNLCAGTMIYAAYNDDKYIVLESSAVDETTCDCVCSETSTTTETTTTETTETTETTSETTEPPTTTGECEDVCGLKDCLNAAGISGPGVLGLDDNGCLTLYELTECETSEQPPTATPYY